MPKCHKTFPNCTWHVPSEWHGLNIDSALLTKVYWNYAAHIVRVCACSKPPKNPNLPFNEKSNLQVIFGSKAKASLYDLPCYHSLTSTDPLSKSYALISLHVSTLMSSITSPANIPRMMNRSILSTHQSLHIIPLIQPTFLKIFNHFLIF